MSRLKRLRVEHDLSGALPRHRSEPDPDPEELTDEYERRRCPAHVRPICSACGFAINGGTVMMVLPYVDQQHFRCFEAMR